MAARVGEETSVKVWVGTAATGVMSFTKSTMARPAMPTKTGAPSRKARPTAVPKVQTSAPGVASGPSSLPNPAARAANPRPGAPSASSGQEPGSGSEASLQRKVRKTTERPASLRSQRRETGGVRQAKTTDMPASVTGITSMLHQKGMPPTTIRDSASTWTRRAEA